MKHLTFLISMLLICVFANAQQTSMTVDNQTPGWLSSKINYGDQLTLEDIKVTGYVNSVDLEFLGTLASERSLTRIDLADAKVVGNSSTDEDVLTKNMFGIKKKTSLSYLALPLTTKKCTECLGSYVDVDTLVAGGKTWNVIQPGQTRYASASCGNVGISNLILREGVDSIAINACNASNLLSVSFPSTLKGIGKKAFKGQSKLTQISLSDSVEYIGVEAFSETSYTPDTLNLPANLKVFYTKAFNEAKVIYLGEKITFIDNTYERLDSYYGWTTTYFYRESDVLEIHIKTKTPPRFSGGTTTLSKSTVYVPKGTKSLYESAEVWKDAYQIIEEIPVEGVSIAGTDILHVGDQLKLTAVVSPEDATNKNVIWTSDDSNILAIESDGTITAKAYGKAGVTVTTADGNYSATDSIAVYEHTTGITVDESLTLNISESKSLDVQLYPIGRNDGLFTLTSSDIDIAKVDANGHIKGVSKGTCVITATSKDGGYTATCSVKVMQPVIGVTLEKHEVTINVGDSEELRVQVTPIDADNKQVVWSTEDESIATVSTSGKITGVKAGCVRIYVKSTENENLSDYCTITVLQPVTGLVLDKSAITLTSLGETCQLTATVQPEDASNKVVRWTSANSTIAYVSNSGSVVAVGEGETVVMATTVDGGFLATCKVTVNTSTGIDTINTDNPTNATYYNVSGQKLNIMSNGINIMRQADGTVRKVLVK